jgi:hypothetical protein
MSSPVRRMPGLIFGIFLTLTPSNLGIVRMLSPNWSSRCLRSSAVGNPGVMRGSTAIAQSPSHNRLLHYVAISDSNSLSISPATLKLSFHQVDLIISISAVQFSPQPPLKSQPLPNLSHYDLQSISLLTSPNRFPLRPPP